MLGAGFLLLEGDGTILEQIYLSLSLSPHLIRPIRLARLNGGGGVHLDPIELTSIHTPYVYTSMCVYTSLSISSLQIRYGQLKLDRGIGGPDFTWTDFSNALGLT